MFKGIEQVNIKGKSVVSGVIWMVIPYKNLILSLESRKWFMWTLSLNCLRTQKAGNLCLPEKYQ